MEITALPIYDVRLIRDKLTSTSRGFCFVELGSVEVMLWIGFACFTPMSPWSIQLHQSIA